MNYRNYVLKLRLGEDKEKHIYSNTLKEQFVNLSSEEVFRMIDGPRIVELNHC